MIPVLPGSLWLKDSLFDTGTFNVMRSSGLRGRGVRGAVAIYGAVNEMKTQYTV